MNFKALDNVPLLMYILAAKTILLCLAFAAGKMYQQRRLEAAMKKENEEKRKLAYQTQDLLDNKKDD
ncbi:small integral membrane protein 11A-like [Alosa sapidissima]|uniref:small integral membrane protein 11A-like n=1 Tax=Alosa sapidissima TaxID=34773 RepID=UPI001C083257|nr:small integral membrane protein 11A-like [Alosa sapidissima]XP_041934657.1 small integral membrane protein 11A-like [Alosa sapidissima]